MVSLAKTSLSSKDDRLRKIGADGLRVLPRADGLSELTLLAEYIGWNYNGVLTGVYFKISGDIWKAVLKVELPSGPKVAFFVGISLPQLVETVHWYASKGLCSWKHDKTPVSVRKPKYSDFSHRPS